MTPSPLQLLKIRSSQGCWTCRLRRKKCDETKPVCAVCAALEITCHFSDAKPEWMDGGAREKAVADELKAMVKAKASDRRERKWRTQSPPRASNESATAEPITGVTAAPSATDTINLLSQNMTTSMALGSSGENTDHEMSGTSPETGPSSVSSYNTGAGTGTYQRPQPQPQPQPRTQQQNDASSLTAGLTPSTLASPEAQQTGLVAQPSPYTIPSYPESGNIERDMHFVMIYLDYVMPFLFPFYRPSLAESGRGWLLVLLMKNKALFHTALSLASYFFSVALEEQDRHYEPNNDDSNSNNTNINTNTNTNIGSSLGDIDPAERTACQEANWGELQTQTELAIRQLQHDMRELNERGVAATPLMEGVRCLESIIQLLQFESAIAATDASENWPVHLDAATALFRELVAHHHADAATALNTIGGLGNGSCSVVLGPWTAIFRHSELICSYIMCNPLLFPLCLERASFLPPPPPKIVFPLLL